MPAHRKTMRKTREILRLRLGERLALREVAQSVRCSPSTVSECVLRAKAAGLSWPLPESLSDDALERQLYPARTATKNRVEPDYRQIYVELSSRKKTGVTLELLWQEYKTAHPDGYQYSQFCHRYRAWRGQLDFVMRQEHRAGEKCFVDYAGMTMPVVDPKTGEVTDMQIFVAAMGASNFIFCEAQTSQKIQDWLDGHIHAFEYFGGVPHVLVPDNLKSGVRSACFYEPDINPSYKELADHYGTVVIPTRVKKPRDKAKVENAVLQVERWVLAPLRKQTFFSLEALNDALRSRLEWLNKRPFSKLEGTRKSLFLEVDFPALQPMPVRRFEKSEWRIGATVNIDYHVELDRHYYSVPHALIRKQVDIRATALTVEIMRGGRCIASHIRCYNKGAFTTDPSHRPKSHQKTDWPPSRILRWAETVGPDVARLCDEILKKKPHPEMGYRSCMGLIRLGKRYDPERLQHACQRALSIQAYSYKSVESILKRELDREPSVSTKMETLDIDHPNIRGADYYE